MADDFRRYCFTPNSKYVKEEPVTPSDEEFADPYNLDYPYDYKFSSGKRSLSTSDIKALCKQNYNKRSPTKTSSSLQDSQKNKFMSMAELIYHYERDTPDRFHSSRSVRPEGGVSRPHLTVPQSPMLHCKTRTRTRHIMSQKEREEMELELIKKHKIKANPIPKAVLEGPKNLPEISKKPVTVPSPFKITEIRASHAHTPTEQFTFKARPVPKKVLSKTNENKPVECKKPNIAKPAPFSFAKRDEEIMRRKEEKIKQTIEEEKKLATKFKAQPLPGVIRKHMLAVTAKSAASSQSSEKENRTRFEARPLPDLTKAYKPVLKHTQTVCEPFQLSTIKRAAERERYEQAVKEREAEQERIRLQEEKNRQEMEQKAIAELRANLVHHAKPPPSIQPFIPEKSNAVITVPETPKFVRRLNQAK